MVGQFDELGEGRMVSCVENERRRFFFLFNDFLENERNGMDGMEGGVVFAIFE